MPGAGNPLAFDRYAYALNNPVNYIDPSGHCVFGLDTAACIAIGLGVLKLVDWGWTAYDAYASANVIASETATDSEKLLAGLNIALAVGFEAIEPDDASPVSLPADDLVRLGVMKGAKEALEEGGEEGLKKFLKDTLGDQADDIIEQITKKSTDDIIDVTKLKKVNDKYLKQHGIDIHGLNKGSAGNPDIFMAKNGDLYIVPKVSSKNTIPEWIGNIHDFE